MLQYKIKIWNFLIFWWCYYNIMKPTLAELLDSQKFEKWKVILFFIFLKSNRVNFAFYSTMESLLSHQQCKRAPFSPHPLQHLLLIDFWIAAILTGSRISIRVHAQRPWLCNKILVNSCLKLNKMCKMVTDSDSPLWHFQ